MLINMNYNSFNLLSWYWNVGISIRFRESNCTQNTLQNVTSSSKADVTQQCLAYTISLLSFSLVSFSVCERSIQNHSRFEACIFAHMHASLTQLHASCGSSQSRFSLKSTRLVWESDLWQSIHGRNSQFPSLISSFQFRSVNLNKLNAQTDISSIIREQVCGYHGQNVRI